MSLMNATPPYDIPAVSPASVTIVDANVDAAEALQALVSAYPGVVEVRTVSSPADAVALLAADEQVVAYAVSSIPAMRRIVLIDLRQDDPSAPETLASLRAELPDAAVVVLCLYPEQLGGAVCSLADRCVPKDTTPSDLRDLLDDLLGRSV
jgi:DNA-binding NarL/FixJ family response regulator